MAVQGPPGQKQHLTTVPTQVDGVGESLEWPRVASRVLMDMERHV